MPRKKRSPSRWRLREAVETPGKTAALVTPDRALARRVVAALERWQCRGRRFRRRFARRHAGRRVRAARRRSRARRPRAGDRCWRCSSIRCCGSAPQRARTTSPSPRWSARCCAARGRSPAPAGFAHALATFRANRDQLHRSDPRWLIADDELDVAAELIARLAAALAPLEALKAGDHPLAILAARHRDAVAALGQDADGEIAAFAGHDGVALARAFEELVESPSAAGLAVASGDYPELFHAAIGDRVVRRPETQDVRVRIFGPLEARLQTIDRVVLGGLNEGTWPPETRSDPWLSRPMRRDLGLDPPERRIGLSAHDFAQALGAKEVILTRAAKLAGAPTVTSRFVQRIAALAGEARWDDVLARGNRYLAYARALDHPAQVKAAERPAPKPPLDGAAAPAVGHRDRGLAARSLHDLCQVHSAACSRSMPVDTPPGARDRGTVIHGAIGDFTKTFAAGLPADPLAELLALGEQAFRAAGGLSGSARVLVAALPAHRATGSRIWDRGAAPSIAALHAEIRGELKFPIGERDFTLSAIADRIERRKDGSYAIIDYKTGAARTEKQVRTGLAPQLTLEAAILRDGGFKQHLAPGSVSEIAYVTLKGGEPAGKPQPIDFKDGTPDSAGRPRARAAEGAGARHSRTRRRPICRWCIRCGRRITATTTTSRASRNGRSPAASDEGER